LEGETLEFQYHYRILPDSILSRFIVLMHEKIHNSTRWRTGVMLEYREGAEVYNIAVNGCRFRVIPMPIRWITRSC
ncbi:MAG: hypothetical protein EAZ09_14615, partial [Oscillatoriales cyanobacterium]